MITEVALFDLKPGMEAQFEAGVKAAMPIFRRAKGCRSFKLVRSIEKPSRYRMLIEWETVENHTVDFRSSQDYQDFRKLVVETFAAPPDVEHTITIGNAF